jgi:serine/threonine protein kinase
VLLTHDMKVKIADFGLSTRIYVHTTERKGPIENVVPFRWAAIEVIQGKTAIKEYSDVWSYGVLIWEIFYLGAAIPYGDKKELKDIIEFLQRGHRLNKPPLCPENIYDVMLDCWHDNYLYRPRFKQLKSQLQTFDQERRSPIIPNPVQPNNLTYTELANVNGSNTIEMDTMAHTNRPQLVLERQMSTMNEYTVESRVLTRVTN